MNIAVDRMRDTNVGILKKLEAEFGRGVADELRIFMDVYNVVQKFCMKPMRRRLENDPRKRGS